MLEIIGVILIIIWFARTARENGKNLILWGVIGGISFYLPIFIMSFLIYPVIITSLRLEVDFMVKFVLFVFNILVGVLGVLLARRIQNYYIDKDKIEYTNLK